MARKGSRRTAELISRLVEIGTATLVEQLGVPEKQAREAMREVAHKLASEYGGSFMYVPKDRDFALDKRDLQIHQRLERGSNVYDVARDYGLTERQIYAVYQLVRKQLMTRQQGALPGFDKAEVSEPEPAR